MPLSLRTLATAIKSASEPGGHVHAGGGSHSQHLRVATLVHLGGCGWDGRPSDRTSIWSCSRGARTAQLAWRHCNGPCEGIAYTQPGACPHDRQRYYSCGTWGYFLAGKLTCSKLTVPFWAIAANLFRLPAHSRREWILGHDPMPRIGRGGGHFRNSEPTNKPN